MQRIGQTALALLLSAAPLEAQQFVDGNALYSACETRKWEVEWYSMGVVDTLIQELQVYSVFDEEFSRKVFICVPPGAKSKQVIDVTCNYLRDNPENRHWSAWMLVSNAAVEAWPCP